MLQVMMIHSKGFEMTNKYLFAIKQRLKNRFLSKDATQLSHINSELNLLILIW